MLSFLVQCQIDCAKIGRAWSPSGTERDMKIGHGRFNAAVECGFFEKRGERWVCTVQTFDTDHALMAVKKANEYIERKKSERELRGHIPTPRKIKTPAIESAPAPAPTPEQKTFQFKPAGTSKSKPEPTQPIVPREISVNDMQSLNVQQFVMAFKQSIWVAECRRRGFGVHITVNTKIDL